MVILAESFLDISKTLLGRTIAQAISGRFPTAAVRDSW
jgi:hypothetical protein